MREPDDFDRLVMASLCPPGTVAFPLLPPDTPADPPTGGDGDGWLRTVGVGMASVILLASLAMLV